MPVVIGPELEMGGIVAETLEESFGVGDWFHSAANMSFYELGRLMDDSSGLKLSPSASTQRWLSVIVFDIGVKEVLFFCVLLLLLHAYLATIRKLCPLPLTANEILAIHQYYEQSDQEAASSPAANSGRFTDDHSLKSGLTAKQINEASVAFAVCVPNATGENSYKDENESVDDIKNCVVEFGNDVCAICLEELNSVANQGMLRRLQCEHVFHQGKQFPLPSFCVF